MEGGSPHKFTQFIQFDVFKIRSPEVAGKEARDEVGKSEAERNPYANLAQTHFAHRKAKELQPY